MTTTTCEIDPAELQAAAAFVTNVMAAVAETTCDRAVMVSAFLTVAVELAARDLTLRPHLVGFYSQALRNTVDGVLSAAPLADTDRTH
jgi:hypothetical protein